MEKGKFLTLNLNTIISGVAVVLIASACAGLWALNNNMVKMQANQEWMTAAIKEIIPRAELDGRFRGMDKDIIELRTRVGATELEIIKLRDKR